MMARKAQNQGEPFLIATLRKRRSRLQADVTIPSWEERSWRFMKLVSYVAGTQVADRLLQSANSHVAGFSCQLPQHRGLDACRKSRRAMRRPRPMRRQRSAPFDVHWLLDSAKKRVSVQGGPLRSTGPSVPQIPVLLPLRVHHEDTTDVCVELHSAVKVHADGIGVRPVCAAISGPVKPTRRMMGTRSSPEDAGSPRAPSGLRSPVVLCRTQGKFREAFRFEAGRAR